MYLSVLISALLKLIERLASSLDEMYKFLLAEKDILYFLVSLSQSQD